MGLKHTDRQMKFLQVITGESNNLSNVLNKWLKKGLSKKYS